MQCLGKKKTLKVNKRKAYFFIDFLVGGDHAGEGRTEVWGDPPWTTAQCPLAHLAPGSQVQRPVLTAARKDISSSPSVFVTS